MVVLIAALIAGCGQQKEEGERPLVAERGKLAPDFTLQDTKGKTWKLSDLKGQVVFINFWATWCPPCRQEMPSMEDLYRSMPADKFKMLAILSNDEPAFADTLAAKMGTTFPILIDGFDEAATAYGITGVPETYIVDKEGVLRQSYIGPRHWNSQEARKMIMDYIKK